MGSKSFGVSKDVEFKVPNMWAWLKQVGMERCLNWKKLSNVEVTGV